MPGNTFDANQLRWLAEAADGKRNQECAVFLGVDGKLKVAPERDMSAGDTRLPLNVFTGWRGEGMRGGVTIQLIYNGQTIDLDADTDAVFLTQTAVEKFVIPYYSKMESPEWLGDKKDELFARDVVAAVHSEPSITTGARPKTAPVKFDAAQQKLIFDVNSAL